MILLRQRFGLCCLKFNTWKAQLHRICQLLSLLGDNIFHVNRMNVRGHFIPLNSQLNAVYHLLALLETHHILHVSRVRVNFFLFLSQRCSIRNVQKQYKFQINKHTSKQTNSTRHRSVQIPITNSALIYTQLSHHYWGVLSVVRWV